ncbi:unnamed protein product, partial [Prunus brigantina]
MKAIIDTLTWQPFSSGKGNALIRYHVTFTASFASGFHYVICLNFNVCNNFKSGTWQHGYGQAWTKVRKVYFPYNLQASHWVAIKIDFVRHTATMYDSYIAFTSTSKLYEMHFHDASKVQEVKQNRMKMSMFTPFTVCSIGDVPQHRDGTSCEILTFKCIEYLSAGISLDKVDPLKIKYY